MSENPVDLFRWREFPSRDALAHALAKEVATALGHTISDDGEAVLAVSGGTTPRTFFNVLSEADLAWDKVIVTLCDERFVPPSSERSNEALARRELLRERARDARFIPLFRDGVTVEEAAKIADHALRDASQPIAVVVLGMGLDGHTASFFPDAPELAHALDCSISDEVIAIRSPSAGDRLSLTLQTISSAWNVFLHIEGEAKRQAFERAMQDGSDAPIRTVIAETRKESGQPVRAFWAP